MQQQLQALTRAVEELRAVRMECALAHSCQCMSYCRPPRLLLMQQPSCTLAHTNCLTPSQERNSLRNSLAMPPQQPQAPQQLQAPPQQARVSHPA